MPVTSESISMPRNAQLLLLALMTVLSTQVSAHHGYERMEVTGSTLLIDWQGEFSTAQRMKLKTWLGSVSQTVSLLHGSLPRQKIRIALKPYPARQAVPFARVLRYEPEGVLFYVNPEHPLDEFVTDWTAYHELSHLFIPYPGLDDVWFSEGLASYYQNILQFRAGLLTREQTLQHLRGGFDRGRKDAKHSELTLGELTPVMREKHTFMRVYWSGALYFLEADIELRKLTTETDTPMTLDDVLREFGACCLLEDREWTGLEIAEQFDQIIGAPLFVPLYKAYEQTNAIPNYLPLLESPEMDAILGADFQTSSLTVQ
jgi:hypothetical protein